MLLRGAAPKPSLLHVLALCGLTAQRANPGDLGQHSVGCCDTTVTLSYTAPLQFISNHWPCPPPCEKYHALQSLFLSMAMASAAIQAMDNPG